jgi:glycerol-3-phosphate acyltransferase PlsY
MMPWLLVPIAYLVGSVSFAWLAGRAKGIDLRQHGSGNLGATNAGRVLGRSWGIAVLIGDLLKGLVPVLIARWLYEDHHASHHLPPGDHTLANLPIVTGVAAVLGHIFTCFHGFKGGKAVATSLGMLIGLVHQVAAITFCTWLLAWAIGYSLFRATPSNAVGPASVMAALVMPFAHLATFPDPWSLLNLPLTLFLFLVSALVVVRHRSNIAKLFAKRGEPPAA